jgi:GNAT superfamily N-acetyltransferase
MKNIKILDEIDNKSFESIIKIGNDNFADGYFTKEYLLSYLNDSDSFVLVYQNHEKIIGFAISTIWDADNLFNHAEGYPSILIKNGITKKDNLHLGIIKTIAIDLEFQKKGIGTELFKASEARLKKFDVKSLVVPAWVYNGLTPMGKILENFQYEPWFCLEKFWISVCDNDKNFCSKRRENSCQCDSYFYKKDILKA